MNLFSNRLFWVTGVDVGGPAGTSKDSRITSPSLKRGGEGTEREESFGERGVREDAVTPAARCTVPLVFLLETR